MNKTVSEINYKFVKNLNPEWDAYSINLQMSKNMDEEDVNDLFVTLNQHEDKVMKICAEKKMVVDSLTLLTEKQNSLKISSSKHSKASPLSDIPELVIDRSDGEEDSDEDLRRFAENLGLLTSTFNKQFGKKKFYSKPKSDCYKADKYKVRTEKKAYEREEKREEKEKDDEQNNRCFNCGKPGHFAKDCRFKKVNDSKYYTRKAQLVKSKEKGKVLMAEEENWLEDTSEDEAANFTQVHYNFMAKLNDDANTTEEINFDAESEVRNSSEPDNDYSDEVQSLMSQIDFMKSEFDILKEKLKQERNLVIRFRNENTLNKCLAEDKEKEKIQIRAEKAKLEAKISELQKDLVNFKSEKAKFRIKFEACFEERTAAYAKIKQLEDLNYKRGQTEQTLKLLTNNPKDTRFYNPKMGLGLPENKVLKNSPVHLYDFDKLGIIETIPDIHETFVKAKSYVSESSEKGKEKIDNDLSDDNTNSQTSSFKSVGFKYDDLNTSCKNRKPEFTEFESLVPISSTSDESVPEVKEFSESECKYDNSDSECHSNNHVQNSEAKFDFSESIPSDLCKKSKIEDFVDVLESKSEKKSEFINSMSEKIFDEMMNASDTKPDSEKSESNSESDKLSVLQKELSYLQKIVEELDDEKYDIQFHLDKSLNENKELCKKIKQLEDSNFKRNQIKSSYVSDKKLF